MENRLCTAGCITIGSIGDGGGGLMVANLWLREKDIWET